MVPAEIVMSECFMKKSRSGVPRGTEHHYRISRRMVRMSVKGNVCAVPSHCSDEWAGQAVEAGVRLRMFSAATVHPTRCERGRIT